MHALVSMCELFSNTGKPQFKQWTWPSQHILRGNRVTTGIVTRKIREKHFNLGECCKEPILLVNFVNHGRIILPCWKKTKNCYHVLTRNTLIKETVA